MRKLAEVVTWLPPRVIDGVDDAKLELLQMCTYQWLIRSVCDLQVQDAGTQQGLNPGTIFTRSLRVPAIWNFFSATACPRATHATPASTISG